MLNAVENLRGKIKEHVTRRFIEGKYKLLHRELNLHLSMKFISDAI